MPACATASARRTVFNRWLYMGINKLLFWRMPGAGRDAAARRFYWPLNSAHTAAGGSYGVHTCEDTLSGQLVRRCSIINPWWRRGHG